MSSPAPIPLRRAWPAYAAAGLAFASAAVSLYWTMGGTALLDALGGPFERLARDRSMAAMALGIVVILVKVVGGLLALALVRPWGSVVGRRWLLLAGGAASVVLVLYGGSAVIVGGLVLGDVIDPSGPIDEHALRWHVFFWDLWFFVWGSALALASWRYHREGSVSCRS